MAKKRNFKPNKDNNNPGEKLFYQVFRDFFIQEELYRLPDATKMFVFDLLLTPDRSASYAARKDSLQEKILLLPLKKFTNIISTVNQDLLQERVGRSLFFSQQIGRPCLFYFADIGGSGVHLNDLVKRKKEGEKVPQEQYEWAELYLSRSITAMAIYTSWMVDKYMPMLSPKAQTMATYSMGILRTYSGEIPRDLGDFKNEVIPIELEKLALNQEATFMDYWVAIRTFANLIISDTVKPKWDPDRNCIPYSIVKLRVDAEVKRNGIKE